MCIRDSPQLEADRSRACWEIRGSMTRTVTRGRSWTFPGHPRGPMRPWPITAQPGRRFSMAVTVPTATWATPGPSSWAVARALRTFARCSSSRAATRRQAVESEATGPKSTSWSRSAPRSQRQSPPSADGGDALCDLGALRDQEVLFGPVASDATAWRLIAALDEGYLAKVREARATARRRVWELAGPPKRLILDIDATLVTAHSEKEGAAGTYKRGFGFHPLLCFEATRGEALSGVLRPGNAGSNTASDHIEVLTRALLQLPAGAVNPGTLVRADSGGATHAFIDAVVGARLSFSVGFDLTEN